MGFAAKFSTKYFLGSKVSRIMCFHKFPDPGIKLIINQVLIKLK